VDGLGCLLTTMVSRVAPAAQPATCFHNHTEPGIVILDYLQRIHTFFGCSIECYAMSFLYIERLLQANPGMSIDALCCHSLLLTSVMLAAKFHDDQYHSNAHYALVGGVQVSDLNALERQFLRLLNWNLYVHPEEYDAYRDLVCKAAPAPALAARCRVLEEL